MPYSILHDVHIKADVTSVFEALTEPKHLNNWWTKKCSGIAEKGSKYNFYFTEKYDWYGEVTECKTDDTFSIKMTKADADWQGTTFGFEVSPKDENVTLIRFFHKDWVDTNAHFRRTSYTWALILNDFCDYVENGTIIPFENRN